MKVTRQQLEDYLLDSGACNPAMTWLCTVPDIHTPEELWNLCSEAHWLWWLARTLEAGLANPGAGNFASQFPLNATIMAIYESQEFCFNFGGKSLAACNAIRKAIPFSAIEDLLVAKLTKGGDPREPFDPDDLDDLDIDDLDVDPMTDVEAV